MPLSGKQIGLAMKQCILPAWRRAGRLAMDAGDVWDGSDGAFTRWRHEEVLVAVGKDGLTRCDNDDFADVCAHFAELAGLYDLALEWHLRSGSDRRRRIEFSLTLAMQEAGLAIPYVQAICRDQYGCLVEDATEAQLINLIRTVRSRGSFPTV